MKYYLNTYSIVQNKICIACLFGRIEGSSRLIDTFFEALFGHLREQFLGIRNSNLLLNLVHKFTFVHISHGHLFGFLYKL